MISTALDYAAALTPLVMNAPHTAPAFVNREMVADPGVYCMATKPGLDAQGEYKPASCTCLSEQATRYEMPASMCRTIARYGGAYNPFKAPQLERQPPAPPVGGAGGTPAAMAPAGAAGALQAARGSGSAEDLQAAYGGFRGAGAPR